MSGVATATAVSLVKSITRRAIWKASKALGDSTPTRFAGVEHSSVWVEEPDFGHRDSFVAEPLISKELETYQSGGGVVYRGGIEKRAGSETIIIPKSNEMKMSVWTITPSVNTVVVDGEALDYAARAKKVVITNGGFTANDWPEFMKTVSKYSHPDRPEEFDAYVAKIYQWVTGGGRAKMAFGKWIAAPPRPDEDSDSGTELATHLYSEATSEIARAHEASAILRSAAVKRSAVFWNRTKRREGSLWKKGTRLASKESVPLKNVAPMRPPTLLRSTSALAVREAYDAAHPEESPRTHDKKASVYIMG